MKGILLVNCYVGLLCGIKILIDFVISTKKNSATEQGTVKSNTPFHSELTAHFSNINISS